MKISIENAIKMLPDDRDRVRTLRQLKGCDGYLAAGDYSKKFLITLMKKYGVYEAGKTAKKMNFGLALQDTNGKLFIETLRK
jgi:hypothetical protein